MEQLTRSLPKTPGRFLAFLFSGLWGALCGITVLWLPFVFFGREPLETVVTLSIFGWPILICPALLGAAGAIVWCGVLLGKERIRIRTRIVLAVVFGSPLVVGVALALLVNGKDHFDPFGPSFWL